MSFTSCVRLAVVCGADRVCGTRQGLWSETGLSAILSIVKSCSVKPPVTDPSCNVKTAATECYPRLSCSVKTAVIRWLWKSCHVSSALVQTIKEFATQKNYKYKRMKHGKQRAIGKIAFNNQQNSLLKTLVIPDWLVSGAKVTCASHFPSRFSV